MARGVFFGLFILLLSFPLFAEEPPPAEAPINFLFRDQFYLSPSQKIRYKTSQAGELLVLERSSPESGSNVAIVSDFAPGALRTQALKGVSSVDDAKEWIRKNKKVVSFEGVPVVELPLPLPDGRIQQKHWVGNKSFDSFDQAAAAVAMAQSVIELQGGNFARAQELAEELRESEPVSSETPTKSRAQFEREEEIALRWIDQLDIGEDLFGPFQGTPAGEPILFQSFGETTWRSTNLAERAFRSQVGFWTNRLVFKGMRAPMNTVDAFVDITVAPETTGNDGGNQLDVVYGLEWRPFARNSTIENFRPWGMPLLKWIKNYRFLVKYMERRNLKDEIANIRDYDLRFGVDIFYEWGIELPPIDQAKGEGVSGFISDHVWGEYFGDYTWRDTNFTAEENFDAWILDTSLIVGLKVHLMKLPRNPVNDELMLMPYFRLGLIYNTRLSNPADNRYYVAAGVRWMPFRDYRFANNEWLFKTKIFAEWLAIGKVQNFKQDDSRPYPDEDWRIGVNWSIRRF